MRLLEREAQLASLAEYADEPRGGHGRLVLIAGEAGVGKSSLLEQLETRPAGRALVLGRLRRPVHAPPAGARSSTSPGSSAASCDELCRRRRRPRPAVRGRARRAATRPTG